MSERHRASRSSLPGDPLEPVDRLVEGAPIGIATVDGSSRILAANRAFCELVGHAEGGLVEHDLDEFVQPVEAVGGALAGRRLGSGPGEVIEERARVVRPDGNSVDALVRRRVVRDESGRLRGQIVVVVDLGAHARVFDDPHDVATALRESEERFRDLAEKSPDLIYRVRLGREPRFEYVNPAVTTLLGYTRAEYYRDPELAFESVHLDDWRRMVEVWANPDLPDEPVLLRMTHRDGCELWTEHRMVRIRDATGEVVAVQGTARDVTALKEAEAALNRRAMHDTLTGLPNRALLLEHIEHEIARRGRAQQALAVLFLDVDHFKRVNDNLGHQAGDRLLVEFARRLETLLRPSDVIARLGGDEFAAVLPDLSTESEAIRIAERLLRAVREPVDTGNGHVAMTVSVGIAFAEPVAVPPAELLRRADVAMYSAKGAGRACVRVYSPGG